MIYAAISTNGVINSYAPAGQRFSLETLAAPVQTSLPATIAVAAGFDKPTFTWSASLGADHYYLNVVDSLTGQVAISRPDLTTTTYTATTAEALTPGQWHHLAIV